MKCRWTFSIWSDFGANDVWNFCMLLGKHRLPVNRIRSDAFWTLNIVEKLSSYWRIHMASTGMRPILHVMADLLSPTSVDVSAKTGKLKTRKHQTTNWNDAKVFYFCFWLINLTCACHSAGLFGTVCVWKQYFRCSNLSNGNWVVSSCATHA